jgi:hypothetical protein
MHPTCKVSLKTLARTQIQVLIFATFADFWRGSDPVVAARAGRARAPVRDRHASKANGQISGDRVRQQPWRRADCHSVGRRKVLDGMALMTRLLVLNNLPRFVASVWRRYPWRGCSRNQVSCLRPAETQLALTQTQTYPRPSSALRLWRTSRSSSRRFTSSSRKRRSKVSKSLTSLSQLLATHELNERSIAVRIVDDIWAYTLLSHAKQM